jgi:hypothetical protein
MQGRAGSGDADARKRRQEPPPSIQQSEMRTVAVKSCENPGEIRTVATNEPYTSRSPAFLVASAAFADAGGTVAANVESPAEFLAAFKQALP